MPTTCPHCGAELPPVSDAFCPECRESLEEQDSRVENDRRAFPWPESLRRDWFFITAFHALAVVCGVRMVVAGTNFILDLSLALMMPLILVWWAVRDANRRGKPISMFTRSWMFLFATVAVPGYVIVTRKWRGVGLVLLHGFLWYALYLIALNSWGFALLGEEWWRVILPKTS